MQIKASFKKELLAFWRMKRFIVLLCVFAGTAALYPLITFASGSMNDLLEEMGVSMFIDVSSASVGAASAVSAVTSIGLLVLLLLLNPFAGGEQKKRAIIIPKCSGLTSTAYLLPKFIVYPLTAYILTMLGTLAGAGVSAYFFEVNNLKISNILLAGSLAGIYMMMYVCLHLSLGTSTGRAGISSAILIAVFLLLPDIFVLMNADYVYNPFALNLMGAAVIEPGHELLQSDITATVLISCGIMVITYFVALFAQNARRVDNSGNEVMI